MVNGNLLKERRNQLQLSMRDMAELMGRSSACSYFRLEHGQAQGNVRQLQLLAEILDLTWDELLGPHPSASSTRP